MSSLLNILLAGSIDKYISLKSDANHTLVVCGELLQAEPLKIEAVLIDPAFVRLKFSGPVEFCEAPGRALAGPIAVVGRRSTGVQTVIVTTSLEASSTSSLVSLANLCQLIVRPSVTWAEIVLGQCSNLPPWKE
jgi:hypothetical protein